MYVCDMCVMCQQRTPTSTSVPETNLKQLTRSQCVSLAVLELSIDTRLALNLQICLALPPECWDQRCAIFSQLNSKNS